MADTLDPRERSERMALVRGSDTKPELVVRRALKGLVRSFRLRPSNLPGRPDIVLPSLRRAIFVHGCFWHRHANCARTRTPKSRVPFWSAKFESNVRRDRRKNAQLRLLGWNVSVIWECKTEDESILLRRLRAVLARSRSHQR
ncbi:MAG: very short patch repair endonuclease [Vicinamibacteria bacterium]